MRSNVNGSKIRGGAEDIIRGCAERGGHSGGGDARTGSLVFCIVTYRSGGQERGKSVRARKGERENGRERVLADSKEYDAGETRAGGCRQRLGQAPEGGLPVEALPLTRVL